MKNTKAGTHALMAFTVIGAVFYIGCKESYQWNMPQILKSAAFSSSAEASTGKRFTQQDARDAIFMTANLIYETLGYAEFEPLQEEALRVIATSVVNKKNFEKKSTLEKTITEKTPRKGGGVICQYSWYCEKNKPVNIDYLKKTYPRRYEIAMKISKEIVKGEFEPVKNFDGVFYATVESYNGKDSWHKDEVRKGKQCKRRIVDGHIHIAPKVSGSCKQNQLAFYSK